MIRLCSASYVSCEQNSQLILILVQHSTLESPCKYILSTRKRMVYANPRQATDSKSMWLFWQSQNFSDSSTKSRHSLVNAQMRRVCCWAPFRNCAQLSAVNATLLAFAAERRAAAPLLRGVRCRSGACYYWTGLDCMYKNVKFSHTRYRGLGPELIPVYRQSARRWREVNHAVGLAVGCHYFSTGLRLPQ